MNSKKKNTDTKEDGKPALVPKLRFSEFREAEGWKVDPWTVLFARAHAEHASQGNDLVPYWVYDEGENPVRVQRCVPIIPLSKEEDQFKRLKENLVLYRLAFGQPRQEDLIAWLSSATGTKTDLDALATWQLDLRPPAEGVGFGDSLATATK